MKNNAMADHEEFTKAELVAMLGRLKPIFAPLQKVWLKCGMDEPGMVLAVICYPDRFAYRVRWHDATTDYFEEYELTDSKKWD